MAREGHIVAYYYHLTLSQEKYYKETNILFVDVVTRCLVDHLHDVYIHHQFLKSCGMLSAQNMVFHMLVLICTSWHSKHEYKIVGANL